MKKYIALIVAIIVLGGGAFFSQQWFVESSATGDSSRSSASGPVAFTATTTGTVLDAMRALAAESELSFSGRDFPGLGFFVEEINGKRNENGYYWILRINGELSGKGVSQARVETGDIIEWN